ncbi:MAG: ABC transporter permease [Thermomicrobiaceae bacterium]|nr:ABC transporter permease [Thermomicrobiaceae bacterium]
MALPTGTRAAARRAASAPLGGELGAALDGIYTLWYRDLLRFARDRSRIVGSFAQPLLFLFIFGTGLSRSMGRLGAAQGGLSYVQFIFPGVVAMTVLFTAIFGAVSIIWDREFGFLKEVLVAPLPRWSLAIGKALGGSTTAMIQGLVMLVFAPLVGVRLTPRSVLEIIPLTFVMALALSALGLLLAARMKSMEGFQLIMNFLMMPIYFLSGALFPLTNLPAALTLLTRIDPASYGVDAIRKVVLGAEPGGAPVARQVGMTLFGHALSPWVDALIVLAFAAVMIALAVRAFNAQE